MRNMTDMTPICNQSEIRHSYYVSVPMPDNISEYYDKCWMRCDPNSTSLVLNSTDPSLSLSETDSMIACITATLASIGGTILNALILLAIIRSSYLRKEYLCPSIVSITLTDLLFSVYILPKLSLHHLKRKVDFPEGCNFFGFFAWGLWMVSVFNLVGIAALRCFAINFPTKTKTRSFRYFCTIIPIMAWVLTLILYVPTLNQQFGRLGLECKIFICVMVNVDAEENPIYPGPKNLYLQMIFLSGIILLVLNVVIYVQVFKQTKKMYNQIKDTSMEAAMNVLQNERKVGKMVTLMTTSFFLVYVPLIILNVVDSNAAITKPITSTVVFFFSYLLVVIDPLVYIVSSNKYRNEIKTILEPIYCRKSSLNEQYNENEQSQIQLTQISRITN